MQRFQRSTVVDIPTPRAGFCTSDKQPFTEAIHFFKAETQNAFTIFLAGAADTLMVLPNANLVPAFLAGLTLVLIMQRPGIVNLPAFFTSVVARTAKLSRSLEHCAFLRPLSVAKASAMPPLVRALTPTAFFF